MEFSADVDPFSGNQLVFLQQRKEQSIEKRKEKKEGKEERKREREMERKKTSHLQKTAVNNRTKRGRSNRRKENDTQLRSACIGFRHQNKNVGASGRQTGLSAHILRNC